MDSGQMKESDTCKIIGWITMAIGALAGILYIFIFGQIEIEGTYYTEKVWSGVMICVGVGIILNSLLVGYLFQKIGSLLAYQEIKAP
jgi:hypothetical protein